MCLCVGVFVIVIVCECLAEGERKGRCGYVYVRVSGVRELLTAVSRVCILYFNVHFPFKKFKCVALCLGRKGKFYG